MTKAFFDTNLWLSFILMDSSQQFKEVKSLLEVNEQGILKIYSSPVIFLELSFVLKSVFKFEFNEILEVLDGVRKTKLLTILSDADLDLALKYFKKYKIKFSDCIKVKSPSELLNSLKLN